MKFMKLLFNFDSITAARHCCLGMYELGSTVTAVLVKLRKGNEEVVLKKSQSCVDGEPDSQGLFYCGCSVDN